MLRVFHDDQVAPGQSFSRHRYDDMKILTYALDGKLPHASMGDRRIVAAGAAHYLSAGTGIMHSEYNGLQKATRALRTEVYAIAGLAPRFGQLDYPVDYRVIGIEAPIATCQDAAAHIARVEDSKPPD